jgi:hypothetical protein
LVRSINEECLNRLIPIGERPFRRAVTEYVAHNRLISGPPVIETTNRVRQRSRLGGLLNIYQRAA